MKIELSQITVIILSVLECYTNVLSDHGNVHQPVN